MAVPERDYNFAHFTRRELWLDGARTIEGSGAAPGREAPDFDLPDTDGNRVRLSSLRGRPVVLHFGSYS